MDQDTTYNGWTNYQTWAVFLWISNEESMYITAQQIVAASENTAEAEGSLRFWLEDELNPLVETASLHADLLGHAFATVNWYEIIKHLQPEGTDNETQEN